MNKYPFREHHLLHLLQSYDLQGIPLDNHIRNYFKANPALGSKDRAEIADTAYGMVRWMGLLDHFRESSPTWEERLEIFKKGSFQEHFENPKLPEHVRVSFPKVLYDLIVKSHGKDLGKQLCLVSNQRAPATIRVNPLKITREELMKRWKGTYEISLCEFSPYGINFHNKTNFFVMPEFKEGLFEVQDEGSQLLADLMQVSPGQQVLDYCSGSGGKTLAFAHRLENKGQVFLHDIRPYILDEAKIRLRRAGIQNGQIINADSTHLKKLKKKMDWVLVDAPCSGTGTLRRNPDMKWKFTQEALTRVIGQQRIIFEKALSYLRPGGHIVYCTCSVLREENEEQIAHFIKTYSLEAVGSPFQSLPTEAGMDGFFGTVLISPSS